MTAWRKEPPTVDEVRAQDDDGRGLSLWWSRKDGVIFQPIRFAPTESGEVREYPTGWRPAPGREWMHCPVPPSTPAPSFPATVIEMAQLVVTHAEMESDPALICARAILAMVPGDKGDAT